MLVWNTTGPCQSAAASHWYLLGRYLDGAKMGDATSNVCESIEERVDTNGHIASPEGLWDSSFFVLVNLYRQDGFPSEEFDNPRTVLRMEMGSSSGILLAERFGEFLEKSRAWKLLEIERAPNFWLPAGIKAE